MGRPRDEERVEARRAEVASATWRAIAEHGIEGASLRTIAAVGGFTTGTLAYYFRNRQEILLFAASSVLSGMHDRLAAALPGKAPLRQLERSLLKELPVTPELQLAWRIWMEFTARVPSDPEFFREHQARYRDLRALFTDTLEAAVRVGELAPGLVPAEESDRLLALVDGIGFHALLEPNHYSPRYQRRLLRSAIRALGRPQSLRS